MAALVLVLSALAVPALCQGPMSGFPPRPKAITGCTLSSFTAPSWFIQDFQTSSGAASFGLLNRATNQTTAVSCEASGSCSAKNSTSLHTSVVQLSSTKTQLLVSDSWTCHDRNVSIAFAASANTSVALTCSGQACKASHPSLLAKGSLEAPVAITPAYANGPNGHDNPGCSAASMSPSWDLKEVDFLYQLGDNVTQSPYAAVTLKIINPALGFDAGCIGFLKDPPALDPVRFSCSGQDVDFSGKNRYSVRTDMDFDPATLQLNINGTWYCDDIDVAEPVAFSAAGSLKLPINCTTIGDAGKLIKRCSQGESQNITVASKLVSKTPLPPYSVEDPMPVADGCTISSVVAPSWKFSDFSLERNNTANTDYITLLVKLNTAELSAFGGTEPMVITGGVPPTEAAMPGMGMGPMGGSPSGNSMAVAGASGSTTWYPCTFAEGVTPVAPFTCSFRYDAASSTLDMKSSWICSDLDENKPILFSGVSSTMVKSATCDTQTGQTMCATETGVEWIVPISNVTWRSQ